MRTVSTSDPGNNTVNIAETLEALFESLESPLLAYAYRLTQSAEVAQDLVQEAFLRLQEHLAKVREHKPWLYRTVHNLAVNHHRKANRMVTLQQENKEGDTMETDSKDDGMLPDESIVHQEALGFVRLSLETLDVRSRELVRLKFEEDMTYRQIAEKTGLSVSNVGYVLHHAVKSLAIELKKLGIGT